MKTHRVRVSGTTLLVPVTWWFLFLAFYLYVWLAIDPRLIYHSLGILTPYFDFSFYGGWPYFFDRLVRPGGLVEYATRFLSQLYCFGWVGALIITAAAGLTYVFTDKLTRLSGQAGGQVVRCVPAAIILMMYSTYSHPLSTILSLLAALMCFLLYVRTAADGTARRLAVLLVGCVTLYWVAGAGGLLFTALVAVYERFVGKRTLVAVIALLGVFSVPWIVGITLVGLSPEKAYGQFLLLDPGIDTRQGGPTRRLFFYSFWPLWPDRTLLNHPLFQRVLPSIKNAFRFPAAWASSWSTQMFVVFAGTGLGVWLSLAAADRAHLEIDYHSQHERWAQVLQAADRMSPGQIDLCSNRNVILALYHTGRLGDQMFRYPQTPSLDLFSSPPAERNHGGLYQLSRLFLYLGQVNYAEKCAYDALDFTGELPALLQHLALISVVKDQPDTARVFLTALSRNPFQEKNGREKCSAGWKRILTGTKTRVCGRSDRTSPRETVSTSWEISRSCCLDLLADNASNRMAFEMLMAQYLLTGQSDKVAENLRTIG